MSTTAGGSRTFAHTADVGVEAWGPDLGTLLARAVEELCRVIGAPAVSRPATPWTLVADGVDREDLVVRALSEALAAFELDGRHVRRATPVAVSDTRVELLCEGVLVDRDAEPGLQEVKAVTYHDLRVTDEPGGVRARVVLDL